MNLSITDSEFDPDASWTQPIKFGAGLEEKELSLFDQNGFKMSPLEAKFAEANDTETQWNRNDITLKQTWLTDIEESRTGPHINHAVLFQRKGFSGDARSQIQLWAESNHLIYKLLKMRPKWGLDLSIDYVDEKKNVMELLHWEWDSFDHSEISSKKKEVEKILVGIDWNKGAEELLKRKKEWTHLDFHEQATYKANYFGVGPEKFNRVVWK